MKNETKNKTFDLFIIFFQKISSEDVVLILTVLTLHNKNLDHYIFKVLNLLLFYDGDLLYLPFYKCY